MSATTASTLTWPIGGGEVVIAPLGDLVTIAAQTVLLAAPLLLVIIAVKNARRRAGWRRFTELRDAYDDPGDPEGLAAPGKARVAMYALAAERQVSPRWMDHLVTALTIVYVAVVLYAAAAALTLVPYPMLVRLV